MKNFIIAFGCLVLSVLLISCSLLRINQNCEPEKMSLKSLSYDTANKEDFFVNVIKYNRNNQSQKKLIIIPPTGGTNYIDRDYAELFCRNDYQVYILDSWTHNIETTFELEIHQRFYANAQKAISTVVDQIKSENATSTIGVLGTSVGGLHAVIAASFQEKVNSVFAIVAGIPIAEVIVKSDQEAMQKLKAERQKIYGFKSDEEQIQNIQKFFHLEPLSLGNSFQKKSLGISIAENDKTVIYEDQLKLKELWKPTTVIRYSSDHFWGIVKTWLFSSKEVLDFFEKNQPKPI